MTITPDKARELLDTARQEAGDGQRPVTVAAKYAPLVEATPALAELVASMHYEYAVQTGIDDNGDYRHMYDWRPTHDEAAEMVALLKCMNPDIKTRIVRRLVGEPEVVE